MTPEERAGLVSGPTDPDEYDWSGGMTEDVAAIILSALAVDRDRAFSAAKAVVAYFDSVQPAALQAAAAKAREEERVWFAEQLMDTPIPRAALNKLSAAIRARTEEEKP